MGKREEWKRLEEEGTEEEHVEVDGGRTVMGKGEGVVKTGGETLRQKGAGRDGERDSLRSRGDWE